MSVGSYSSRNDHWQAASDTGSSFIVVPVDDIYAIAATVSARYNSTYGLYIIPCNATPPDIVFTIGAHQCNINAANYIINTCNRPVTDYMPYNSKNISVTVQFSYTPALV